MANELSALVEVGGDAVDRLVVTPAESLHKAVAGRIFRSTAPFSAPTRIVHDGIARAVYASVRVVARVATASAASSVGFLTRAETRPLSRSRRGRAAVSGLNALIGDRLHEEGSPLAIPMAIRRRGADVPCEREALRRSFRRPATRVAVFLHGLGETEERWGRGAARHRGRARLSFGEQLHRDLGITPIEIRYNSGLHISDNGRRLSELLEDLLGAWPVPVKELILIGHSMGGLVARSACHAGSTAGARWPSRARHLITLGSPHTGVPLEKLVHSAARALGSLPETRAIAGILDLRSAGIRDLRFGYVIEDDWREEDPTRLFHRSHAEVLPLGRCTSTFITATVSRDPRHPLGWLGGDFLVRRESAAGRRRDGSVAVPADQVIHLGALSHFDLLDHPLVYAQIRDALLRQIGPSARGGPHRVAGKPVVSG
jgi:pimeloyl-ACP methyl ester carboxylesterase